MSAIHFITASTSGHTEHVVDVLQKFFADQPGLTVKRQKAELTKAEDLLTGDLVILGSGTWNTGGTEGQLNMHMQALLKQRATGLDLKRKPITFISLGDERYYFTTRCTEHFLRFQREHNGTLFAPPLILVNEPYGQEDKIRLWGEKLLKKMQPAA